MVKFARQKRLILAWVILIGIAASIYRIIVIKNNIEITRSDDFDYYLFDSPATYYFAVLTAGLILLCIITAVYLGKRMNNSLVQSEPSVIFTSSLSGFLLFGAVFYYIFYFSDHKNELSPLVYGIIASAAISAVFFLMNASGRAESNKKAASWLSLAPIAFFAFRLLYDFIRQSTMHNVSSAPYLLLSLVAFLLFFLAEGKFRVGSGNITFYMLYGFLSVLLSLIYALPALALSAFWLLPTNYTMIYSAIDLTIVLYIVSRVFSLNCPEADECSAVPAQQS